MPIVEVPALSALGLILFQLNPHYLDSDREHAPGRDRQQRIEEFEENDVPVLGLREGAWLGVSGERAILAGASTGRLFAGAFLPDQVASHRPVVPAQHRATLRREGRPP